MIVLKNFEGGKKQMNGVNEVNEVNEAVNEEDFYFYTGDEDDTKTYQDEGFTCCDTQGYTE